MENLSLLKDGAVIMSLGMSCVFSFLVIMVFAMKIMAFVIDKINKFFPEVTVEEIYRKTQNSSDSEIALAIALAYAKAKKH